MNRVYSRDGKIYGMSDMMPHRTCNMEGCRAFRIKVIWPDGKYTLPCMGGIKSYEHGHYIIM